MNDAIVIIGGGLAGSALAIQLCRQNRRVVLLEKNAYPREKLCGEFLSAEALACLDALGCLQTLRRLGAVEIDRAQFISPNRTCIDFRFPEAGLGVSRCCLDTLLWERAQASGCEARDGTKAVGVESTPSGYTVRIQTRHGSQQLHAQLVIGAQGKRSQLDQKLKRDFLTKPHPYMALKQHGCLPHRAGFCDSRVEMYVFPGGYCGISRIEDGWVNVCMLLHQNRLRTVSRPIGRAALAESLKHVHPGLGERLDEFIPNGTPLLAAARIPFVRKTCTVPHLLFVGDAVELSSPLCGNGQSFALQSALQLASLIQSYPKQLHPLQVDQIHREWKRMWRKYDCRPIRMSRTLQWIVMHPRLAKSVMYGLSRFPLGLPWLFRLTRGKWAPQGESTGTGKG